MRALPGQACCRIKNHCANRNGSVLNMIVWQGVAGKPASVPQTDGGEKAPTINPNGAARGGHKMETRSMSKMASASVAIQVGRAPFMPTLNTLVNSRALTTHWSSNLCLTGVLSPSSIRGYSAE